MADVLSFINILDHERAFLAGLIDRAIADKETLRSGGKLLEVLTGKTLAMYFDKPSLRTRLSFEIAVTQLGGHGVYLTDAEIGLGKREPIRDVARVISSMCDGVVVRTFEHEHVVELARFASVPVINALTDYSHPCQAMADLMTAKQRFGRLDGLKLTFIGDGHNVARSLAGGCARLGVRFVLAAPRRYQLDDAFVESLQRSQPDVQFDQTDDPRSAVEAADIVYTDTWVSMDQQDERERRLADFQGYQVNSELLKSASADAVVMHCLPAYRGYEITEDVMESRQSVIFEEAENRLHFQRALLAVLIGRQAKAD